MRNFLSTTFKVFSRSFFITTLFALTLTSVVNAQSATVNFIKVDGKENQVSVAQDARYVLSWSATNAAICGITTNEDRSWSVPPNGSIREEDWGTLFSDTDSIIYTITCYTQGQRFRGDTEFTTTNPLSEITTLTQPFNTQGASTPKTVTVSIENAEDAICEEDDEKCRQICENYPGSTVCGNCKVNPDSAGCLDQCLEEGQPICTGGTDEVNEAAAPTPERCGVHPSTWGKCLIDAGIYIIDSTAIPFFAAFLSLCAMLFEIIVYFGVVKFSVIVGPESGGWITTIWGTIRDILNIGVIFVLLYAAINIIVGRGGEIKKLIAGVILFGVLTNFSLFFTKAAVDLSNVVALEFYNQMRGPDTTINETSFLQGVGATVVQTTGLIRFYDTENLAGKKDDNIGKGSPLDDSFLYRFAMIIVMIAVSFIFLQAAFIFLGRTVSLIFLLIFSPLMFAGGVFAPLQKWIKKWHEEFIGQTILAPVFFILLYVAITILANLKVALEGQLEVIKGESGEWIISVGLILLTAGLTIFAFSLALNKAKEMAGSIGGKFAGWGSKLSGMAIGGAGRLALGGTASGLRSAAVLSGVRKLSNWAENSNSLAGSTARLIGLNKIKDSTLDIRNTKVGGKIGSGVAAALGAAGVDVSGVKLGEGSKTKLADQKSIIQTVKDKYGDVKKGVQERADKRGERLVEKTLQDLEEEQKDAGIKTDYEVFDFALKYRDAEGKIQSLERGLQSDEEWVKEVKKVNQKNKTYIEAKKLEYLKSAPALSIGTFKKGFIGRRGLVAEYRAREKFAKKFKESPEAKLQAYTDDLKKYADLLGVTEEEIKLMKEEDVLSSWQEVKSYKEKQLKDHEGKKPADTTSAEYKKWAEEKRKLNIDLDKAKNASKKVGELKKKIEEEKKKKDEGKDKK